MISLDISVKRTNDGSATLYNATLNEHYHSIHGALTESKHVFIENGFVPAAMQAEGPINILEIGFGTGLNAALTAKESELQQRQVRYIGLEPFPVPADLLSNLRYDEVLDRKQFRMFSQIHQSPWEEWSEIHPCFQIRKAKIGILDFNTSEKFGLIYFDAFAPEKQPDMWKIPVLQKCHTLLEPGGIFITYCAKGQFKRDMKRCGFTVEAKPGPPFKREITFAGRH